MVGGSCCLLEEGDAGAHDGARALEGVARGDDDREVLVHDHRAGVPAQGPATEREGRRPAVLVHPVVRGDLRREKNTGDGEALIEHGSLVHPVLRGDIRKTQATSEH